MTAPAKPTKGDPAKQRKVSPALLVVLGILVVGLIVRLVTLGGGGPEQTSPVPTPTASPTATGGGTTPAASPSPSPTSTAPPSTFEVFESKDPFRPLVVAAEAPGGTGGTPAPPTAPTAGPGAGGAPAPSGGQRVEVIDVITDGGTTKAQVKVGSTVHTVAPGETFATTFKVLSISGDCVTMLNGDDKFTLCKGETVLK